jgi:CBS domain containing-hemolysin-like protein
MLTASRNSGTIQESEWNLATRVLDFSHSQAKDVMIPRPDVTFVDSSLPLPEIVRLVSASGHTRFPVIRNGNPDEVIGIIHVKELVKLTGEDITPALRTVLRVPETKSTEALLRTMQRMRTHMSVVVDEYGGTAGIVTIEDIVEEIVGDIQDEFETDLPELVRDNQAAIVDARMTLVKLTRHFEITMPENDEDIETVGGWILANASQATIKPGTTVPFGGYTFTVIEVTGRRVRRVRVSTTHPGEPESNRNSADAS